MLADGDQCIILIRDLNISHRTPRFRVNRSNLIGDGDGIAQKDGGQKANPIIAKGNGRLVLATA